MFGRKESYAQKMIAEINGRVATIKNLVADPKTSMDAYQAQRVALNMSIIQALTGGVLVPAKKAGEADKMKFNKPLPTPAEVAQITLIVEDYVRNIEEPFLSAQIAPAAPATNDDDMSIPKVVVGSAGVPSIDKVNNKKLAGALLDINNGAVKAALTAADCNKIYSLGVAARKDHNKKVLVVGGITLTVVAGVAAVVVYKHNKDKEELAAIDDDDLDVCDVDDEDLDVGDIDDDDIEACD